MAKLIYLVLFSIVLNLNQVDSASLLERSYDYVVNLGKNFGPGFMSLLDCMGEDDMWACAKMKAGKILDSWDAEVDKQRSMWQQAADAEIASSGRSYDEMPSKLGREVEASLISVADLLQQGMARALSRKHHEDSGGGIDSITISTGGGEKKKMKKKKKTKPPKIHLVHPMMVPMGDQDRAFGKVQSWVIGTAKSVENDTVLQGGVRDGGLAERGVRGRGSREGRGIISDLWTMGEKAIDAVAEHAIDNENQDNGVEDKSSLEETRGKKKKKKKAILKLLILGAVLKAKIGTLLQILSFKLQVKFFLIALVGLGINLARFWIDLKKQHQPPQKVIYYEHAQHQHHYEHEEEDHGHGWGPWSRAMDPEEADVEVDLDVQNSPYRAHVNRNAQYNRPLLTRV